MLRLHYPLLSAQAWCPAVHCLPVLAGLQQGHFQRPQRPLVCDSRNALRQNPNLSSLHSKECARRQGWAEVTAEGYSDQEACSPLHSHFSPEIISSSWNPAVVCRDIPPNQLKQSDWPRHPSKLREPLRISESPVCGSALGSPSPSACSWLQTRSKTIVKGP